MGIRGRSFACARVLAIAALAFLLNSPQAIAQSRVCQDLQTQFSALSSRSSKAQVSSYDRAIAKQTTELDRARSQGRRCSGLFANRSECRAINSTIRRMSDNLADLQRKRRQAGGGSTQQRARLLKALEANGCRVSTVRRTTSRKKVPAERELREETSNAKRQQQTARPAGTTFRTMCVRLCDGYYFPISFSVPPSLFPRDAQACEARCPGTVVALYTHRVPDEESEDMVSASDGSPYRALDTAFLYRRQSPNACGCAAAQPSGFTALASEHKNTNADEGSRKTSATLLPPAESAPIEEWGKDGASKKEVKERPVRALTPADRRVRAVGPMFFPDPEEAIDLRAPVPTPVR